jgi:hypothetical protein
MLVDALQDILANDATLVALLGSSSTRPDSTNGIFPVQSPDQPTMPYVVYSQASGDPMAVTLSGTIPLTQERWRFSCFGSTYRNAKQLAKKLRLALIDVLPGENVVGDVWVSGMYCVMEADELESIGRGTLFSTILDFNIVYTDNDSSN